LRSLAGRPAHGARLARQQELDGELLALALRSPPAVMLEAADYLADKVRRLHRLGRDS
jgi:intraflagellar transport protein 140